MAAKLLMFLNLLLTDRPAAEDLRFVKTCLGDVMRFGDQIGHLTRNKLR